MIIRIFMRSLLKNPNIVCLVVTYYAETVPFNCDEGSPPSAPAPESSQLWHC